MLPIDVSTLTPALNAISSSGFNGVIYIVDNTPATTSGASPSPNPKFGPETISQYEEAARKLLPQVATKVTLVDQVKNPWPINGWQSHRFIFSYATATGEVQESITFLNIIPTQQVIIQVYAAAKDFPGVSSRGYDTIRRWHELDPSTAVRGN